MVWGEALGIENHNGIVNPRTVFKLRDKEARIIHRQMHGLRNNNPRAELNLWQSGPMQSKRVIKIITKDKKSSMTSSSMTPIKIDKSKATTKIACWGGNNTDLATLWSVTKAK